MAYITELLGFIGLDVDESSFDKAGASILDITKNLAGMVAAVGAVDATLKGLTFGLVNAFAETAVEVDRVSKRLNVNAEAFQKSAYAASAFGIEQEQLADGMKELSMRAGEFALTGEGSFKDVASQLGLTREQVKSYGNDIGGLFNLVRDKLADVKNQGQRQFLADALFGGGLADVGGEFFAQTSTNIAELQKQAMDSGIIISDESIAMSKQYTRDIAALTSRIKGLWQIIASNLLPVFSEFSKRIKGFLDLHGEDIIDGLTAAFSALSTAVKYLGIAAAIAMPYLIGAAAISGWAKLISLVTTVTTSFTALRFAALLAWAAAAVGPVLVGSAIIALILIVQDLYTYFTGGDSVTGKIIDSFKDMDLSIRKIWDGMIDYIISAIDRLDKALFDAMPEWVQDTLKALSGGGYNPGRSNKTQSNLQSDIPGHDVIQGYKQIITGKNLQPDIPGQYVIIPPTNPIAERQASVVPSVASNDVNITGPITVKANDPHELAAAMRNIARQENMRNNASTVKNLNGGVTY